MNVSENLLTPAKRFSPRPGPLGRLSGQGTILFLTCLALAGSSFALFRFRVGEVHFHPYFFPLALLIPGALARLGRFPADVLSGMALFFLTFVTTAVVGGPGALGVTVKMAAILLSVVCVSLAVRGWQDVQWAVLGMAVAVTAISLKGLLGREDRSEALDPMELASPNTLSVYVLPALLVGGYVILDPRPRGWVKQVLVLCTLVMLTAQFSTTNRSGWAGAVFIALMLFAATRGIRGKIALLTLAVAAYFAVTTFGSMAVVERRYEQTVAGYRSDELRWELFLASMDTFRDYPLLGASPQGLPMELAKRIGGIHYEGIEPHNVVGYLFGGCGLITVLAFAYLAWSLWHRPRSGRGAVSPNMCGGGHALLRMMLLLWLLRGQATGNILYAPAFALGIGLALGLAIQEGTWARGSVNRSSLAGNGVA